MASKAGGSGGDRKGKKEHKNKPTSKKYSLYNAQGKTARFCVKCGPGIFMAKHSDRLHCGKCGYTEFNKK